MRELQRCRLEESSVTERERKTGMLIGRCSSSGGPINFEKQLRMDNSVIGSDEFDADAAFQQMMSLRPSSTSYDGLDTPAVDNMFRNRKFDLQEFNRHFVDVNGTAKFHNDGIDAFTGFEEIGGAANVVSDGHVMFVQGQVSNKDTTPFGMLDGISEYDRDLEKRRYEGSSTVGSDQKVSDADLQKFSQYWNSAVDNGTISRLTKNQFKERMTSMEKKHAEEVSTEQMYNRDVVAAQMAKLSEVTKRNLGSSGDGIHPSYSRHTNGTSLTKGFPL